LIACSIPIWAKIIGPTGTFGLIEIAVPRIRSFLEFCFLSEIVTVMDLCLIITAPSVLAAVGAGDLTPTDAGGIFKLIDSAYARRSRGRLCNYLLAVATLRGVQKSKLTHEIIDIENAALILCERYAQK